MSLHVLWPRVCWYILGEIATIRYLQKFEYLRKRVQYLLLVEGAFILLPRKMIRGLWSSPYSQMYSSCKFRRYLYSDDRTCVRAVYSIIIAVVCQ